MLDRRSFCKRRSAEQSHSRNPFPQAAREAELLEERRRREEAARREKERLERELEEQEQAEAKALLEQAAARKKKGGVVLKEGEKIDKASLMKVGGFYLNVCWGRGRVAGWGSRGWSAWGACIACIGYQQAPGRW